MTNTFEYNYTAPTEKERKLIEKIKQEYSDAKSSNDAKIKQLKLLDKKVKNTPVAISLTMGILGLLIFGLGFSLILEFKMNVIGIIIAVIGLCVIAPAYFIHNTILNKLRKKHSKEIIKLCCEILDNE